MLFFILSVIELVEIGGNIRPNLHLDIVRSGIHCDALITFFFKIEYEGIVKIVIKPKLTEFALFVVKFVLLNLHFSVWFSVCSFSIDQWIVCSSICGV